jgi:hypothetical protein
MSEHKFVIEKDVPMPATAGAPGRNTKYPFGVMEKGDSFYAHGDDCLKASVRAAAYRHKVKSGKSFACRADEHGVRIWRVA